MASRSQILPRGVHDISAALHLGEQGVVEQMIRLGMKRAIDGDDVAGLDHALDRRMPGQVQLLLGRFGKPVAVGVMQLDVEGREPAFSRASATK
jgi:hypothetical protein